MQLLISLILTILPFIELRGGLPVIIDYALRNNLSVWPYFVIVLILNILLIFFIFFFLDFLHIHFMRLKPYKKFMEGYMCRLIKKSIKFQKNFKAFGYLALCLFVAIPLPGTGAWTGSFLAWFLKLDRLKSFIAIAMGVIIAGFIVLFISLGVLQAF